MNKYESFDIIVSLLESNAWCNPSFGSYTITDPVINDFCSVLFNSSHQSATFIPPKLDPSVCDNYDDPGLWSIQLEDTSDSLDQKKMQVTMDPSGTV